MLKYMLLIGLMSPSGYAADIVDASIHSALKDLRIQQFVLESLKQSTKAPQIKDSRLVGIRVLSEENEILIKFSNNCLIVTGLTFQSVDALIASKANLVDLSRSPVRCER